MTVSAMLTLLVQGFGKSLEIFTLTLLGSLPLGLLVMFGRRSRVAPLRWLVKLFISVMRGTPLMLQLMVVYYGPFLLFDFTPPGNWRFGAKSKSRRATSPSRSGSSRRRRCSATPAGRPSGASFFPR